MKAAAAVETQLASGLKIVTSVHWGGQLESFLPAGVRLSPEVLASHIEKCKAKLRLTLSWWLSFFWLWLRATFSRLTPFAQGSSDFGLGLVEAMASLSQVRVTTQWGAFQQERTMVTAIDLSGDLVTQCSPAPLPAHILSFHQEMLRFALQRKLDLVSLLVGLSRVMPSKWAMVVLLVRLLKAGLLDLGRRLLALAGRRQGL